MTRTSLPNGFELCPHRTVGELRATAVPLLAEREAENHMFLGILGEAPDSMEISGVTIRRGREVVACALAPPGWSVIISRAEPALLRSMAEHLAEQGIEPRGVLGPQAASDAFADLWRELTGVGLRRSVPMGVYELEEVIPPTRPAPGRMVQATGADLDLLTGWIRAFSHELDLPHERPKRLVKARVEMGGFYLWLDPGPVTMAAWAGRTPSGARILWVYTPPELRRRGYATTCVAELSRLLLDHGMTKLFLNTEMSNPTSNSIYQHIGYCRVSLAVEHFFETG